MLIKTKFRTLDLALDFYARAKGLKLTKRYMQDQFDRALLSVVLNLAEGSAKPTKGDRLKFYAISLGSLKEVQVLLHISGNRVLLTDSDAVYASLYCLCRSLRPSPKT